MSKICLCQPYEDELLYSVLARTKVKNAYIAYTYAAKDFLLSSKARPDIEFVNVYTDKLMMALEKIKPFKNWIKENTMFDYYSYFIPENRKRMALESLIKRDGQHGKHLCMPAKGNKRFLRICPICYQNEIKKYGEAYWHRSHQMMEINVCTTHNCRLTESTVKLSGAASPSLITPTEAFGLKLKEETKIVTGMELTLAQYVADTFKELSVIEGRKASAGKNAAKFLYDNLEGTKYVSARGEQRKMSLLQSDFNDYYSELGENTFLLKDYEQLQKIFTDYRFNFYEICQLGLFLKIPPKELANLKNDKSINRQITAYDNRVIEMSMAGISGNEIARRMGASSRTVRTILSRHKKMETVTKDKKYIEKEMGNKDVPYSKNRLCSECVSSKKSDNDFVRKNSGVKKKDWEGQDEKYLSQVENAIRSIYGVGDERPHKVTVFAVSKKLGLPDKTLYRMPKCLAKIKKYEESQEDYWKREVLWAIRITKKKNIEVNWKRIRELTNLRKSQFEALNIFIDSL